MKLSIIIPVYNVRETLRTCVESAYPSTFDDWEMILVEDGSKDGSDELCDQLAIENSHLQIVHQENQGLSKARNTGLEQAKGEYIAFMDSDDCVQPGTFDILMAEMMRHPEYDLLEFPAMVYRGGPKESNLTFQPRVYTCMRDYWIDERAYAHAYAWNKIYRRELFNEVRYPVGHVFEDVYILPQLLKHVRTLATTGKGLYYYNYNPNSITNAIKGSALRDLLNAHIQVFNHEQWLLQDKDIAAYYAHVLNIQLDVYEYTGEAPLLPFMRLRGNYKIKLLNLLGIKRLCRYNKLLHLLAKPFK